VLLLTGATGLIGSSLLRRLTARGEPVRCLVRDPRRLGPERVRVQITIGDLTDPRALRRAMRGVSTVVHLAASHRDQPHATIEELAGMATWRLLRAAEQAGVEHFVFFSALGATPHHPGRLVPGGLRARLTELDGDSAPGRPAPTLTSAACLPRRRTLRVS